MRSAASPSATGQLSASAEKTDFASMSAAVCCDGFAVDGAGMNNRPVPLPSIHASANWHSLVGHQKHDLFIFVWHTQNQDFRHEFSNLACRKVDDG